MHYMIRALSFFPQAALVTLLAFLCGCDAPQPQTLVTLHHIQAETLKSTLSESLGPDIKFSITGDKIVIFASINNIAPTLELLKSLDTPPVIVSLHFRKLKQHDYSTSENSQEFYIKENKENKVIVNNEIVRVVFKRSAADTFILKMTTKKNQKINEVVFEIKEGAWKRIRLKGLEGFPMVRVQLQY